MQNESLMTMKNILKKHPLHQEMSIKSRKGGGRGLVKAYLDIQRIILYGLAVLSGPISITFRV